MFWRSKKSSSAYTTAPAATARAPPSIRVESKSNTITIDDDPHIPHERLEMSIKILVVGGTGVGRSSFIRKYSAMFYAQPPEITKTVDPHSFLLGDYRMGDPFPPNMISLELCEVAPHMLHTGTTQLSSLMSNVDGVVLLTDHHEASLTAIDSWRACLAAYVSCQNIPMLLVVTKNDISPSPYPSSVLDSYCSSSGLIGHISTTARSRPSCEAAVDKILTEAIGRKMAMAREKERKENKQEKQQENEQEKQKQKQEQPHSSSSAVFVTTLSAIPNYNDIHPAPAVSQPNS